MNAIPEKLTSGIRALERRFREIPPARQQALRRLAEWITKRLRQHQSADIVVICTHNSRRSHMGQLWLQVGAAWYGLKGVRVWSGGTEATAFHPNAVAAARRFGFPVERVGEGDNPRYELRLPGMEPVVFFSKRFDDPVNPQRDFAAVMVCSDADEACPFVPGAAARFSLPFADPKEADGRPDQDEVYDARFAQIGTEMLFVMREAARLLREEGHPA